MNLNIKSLSDYIDKIAASNDKDAADFKIVHTETTMCIDDGITTERTITSFKFSDGVVISKEVEFDHLPEEEPQNVCPEYWLSYQVITNPNSIQIKPFKKTFSNLCQQSFWLKMTNVN
ncbi:hypothetical protein [Vibrio sp.]|uniref:hypothetical protein n=1 Tax=Vibrio sp. TaxID=678 RepID=UPI003AA9069A